MPVYIYETLEEQGKPVRRFEVRQGMTENALTHDPSTGEPVRRVITGGYGILQKTGSATSSSPPSGGSCGTGCGCH